MQVIADRHEPQDVARVGPASARALFTVATLGVVAGVQMADRGLQAILLSDIQRSYAVGDGTIGVLQGLAGILLGSAIAVPIARLGDRYARRHVLLGLIVVWTALVVASALAPDFPLFFVCRTLSGATEFAMIPIVYAMIPDLVPEGQRVYANLAFAAMMAGGMSAGLYFGEALVAQARAVLPLAIEPWRKAYLLLAGAGGPLFVLALCTLDPPRHAAASDPGRADTAAAFLTRHRRSVGLFVGVAGSLMVAVQALTALVALALERRFGADLAAVGRTMGVVILATSVGCLPVAGGLDRLLRPRFGRRARPVIMGAAVAAALPCALVLPAAESLGQALAAVALFLFLTCTANALVPTTLQDLTPPAIRARSFAIWSFTVSIFCAAGPVAAGYLSDILGGEMLTAIGLTAAPALGLSAACAAGWAMRGDDHG